MAGATPVETAASTIVMIQIITTGKSNARSSTRGSDGGAAIRSDRINTAASSRPIALPATAISALSVNSCRASRARRAPAECGANRKLPLAGDAAREEQTRDIGARDWQDQRRRGRNHRQRRTRVHGHVVAERPDVHDWRTAFPEEEPGQVVRRRTARSSRALCLGLRHRDVRLQPPQRREHERSRLRRRRLQDSGIRYPESHPRFRKREGRRHDADDRVGDAVDVERRADRVGGGEIPIVRARASGSRLPLERRTCLSSSDVNSRPLSGATPSVPSTAAETRAPGAFTGSPPSVR